MGEIMAEKYRNAVKKPIKFVHEKIKHVADMDAPTKTKKILKGSALVGMGLTEFMMQIGRVVALDNKLMRRLEKKLSEIQVGRDKDGNEKKFQSFVKRNPNMSAVAIWWAMLGMLIGGGSAIVGNKKSDKDIISTGRQQQVTIKSRPVADGNTASFDVVDKRKQIKNNLGKKIKMTDRKSVKQAVMDNFAYTQAVLFSTENYRTDWFCDYINGDKNTLAVGLYYVPDAKHPYDFTSTSWAKASVMYKKYPKTKSGVPRPLTDNEVYDGIAGWFFYMDGGRAFNKYMCDVLAETNIELTPRDLTVIASVLFNSPQCCKKFCEYIVAHPNSRTAWAKYLLNVDDDVDVKRLKNFPGLKARRVHEILLLLDIDNYCNDMFGVQIDCKRSGAVSYANNYFDKLKHDFSKSTLKRAKSVICNGVVANGMTVCQVVQKSDKYRDDVFAYCADVDLFLYGANRRQKIYEAALADYKQEKWDSALAGFNKVIELEGVSPSLFNDLAITYIHYGDYEKSVEMSERAVEIGDNETMSASYFNMGLAYENMGKFAKAKKSYKKAVQLGNAVAQSRLNKLNNRGREILQNATKMVQQKNTKTSKFAKSLFGRNKD